MLNASKIPSAKSNAAFKKQDELEVGNYIGRVVQVISLGLQIQRTWNEATRTFDVDTEKKPAYEIYVTYELGTEFMKDVEGQDMVEKPRWISETFKLLPLKSEKATSTKRMLALDPKNELKGDWSKALGLPCTITIGHSGSGKAKVGNISPVMKGFTPPELVNPPKVFDASAPDMEVYESLPEFLKERIKSDLNFSTTALAKLLGEAPSEAPQAKVEQKPNVPIAAPVETPVEPPMDFDDSELPF